MSTQHSLRITGFPRLAHAVRRFLLCFVLLDVTLVEAFAGVAEAEAALREKDYVRAARELRSLAQAGRSEGEYGLGLLFYDGLGVTQDWAAAFSWFSRAAKQGHVAAQYRLGLMHADGEGTEKDPTVAAVWLTKAGRGGSAEAQHRLGHMYAFGYLGKRNLSKGQYWLELAARQDMTAAQIDLATVLVDPRNESQDHDAASRWVARAAELGDAEGQYRLAKRHDAAREWPKALALYREAATKGHSGAQASLGRMYLHGDGVAIDYKRAFDWLALAAAQGESTAFYNLGSIFERGLGQRQDALLFVALRWAAAEAQSLPGAQVLHQVSDDLTADELAFVGRLATALQTPGRFRSALDEHLGRPRSRSTIPDRGQQGGRLVERQRP